MAECVKCGDYTKFNGGFCLACYKADQKENKSVIEKPSKEEIDGLTDQDWSYRYNMIKGRIAETLIQELFLSLDFS